jgi:hypothetical protein
VQLTVPMEKPALVVSTAPIENTVPQHKVDFRRERKDLYAPSAKDFSRVTVPPLDYLMIDGEGDPNTSESHAQAIQALYAMSYAAKFASKLTLGRDYVVGPLEGLWHSARMESFVDRSKNEWQWTMMIRQPGWLTDEIRDAAREKAHKKQLPAVQSARWQSLDEGDCVQILHIGSYDDEGPTLARLHSEYLPVNGLVENGLHHEIYIGDPRRVEAAKLKTVLRQPVRPGGFTPSG